MSTKSQKESEDQEIDLTMISKGIGNFFQGISRLVFNGIQFIIKNAVIIIILFAVGVGLGIYLDKTQKTYNHQIIVTPNFGSTDYLYSKIDLIESKIKERDTVFLKTIGLKEPSAIAKITIEPVMDVYQFINNSEQNFALLKLMAEDGDLKKIVEEKTTSKNYTYHVIRLVTKSKTSNEKTISPLINFLNDSDYYKKMQKEYVNNLQLKMTSDNQVISQIDGFLNSFTNTVSNAKNDKLVYYNENTQLNDVIKTKDQLVEELGKIRINLVSSEKIIRENSSTINVENTASVNGKLKLILPFLFLSMFIFLISFKDFYKRQSLKNKQE